MRNDSVPEGDLGFFLLLKSACHQVTTRAAAHAERTTGVHGAQALALMALDEAGECSVTALADRIGARMSAAAALVKRLERDGCVTRRRSETDARAFVVRLSARGAEAAASTRAMVTGFDKRLRRGFTEDELDVVRRFLTDAAESIEP